MSKADDDQPSLGRDRARLINERLIELFRVRAKCERARSLQGEVPLEHQIALFNQIRDAYLALRPLRDETAIDDWWESVTLSPRWGDWNTPVDPEETEDAVPLAKTDQGVLFGVFEPYEGLGTLDNLRDMVTEREQEVPVFGGVKEKTVREPNLPEYDILLDISSVLEDAADRLGFAPDVAEATPRTQITAEKIEEVEAWRKANNLE